MEKALPISNSIMDAIQAVRRFITETTGQKPSDEEIAAALKRYFVLNEIKAHILMDRETEHASG